MPLGATPSRWCVCQFHHFRAAKLLYVQSVAENTAEGLSTSVSIFVTTFCHRAGKLPTPKSSEPGKKRTDCVRLRIDATQGRLDVIVGRRVLQRERDGMFPRPGQECVPQLQRPVFGWVTWCR
jgi:hypothetical protein